MFYLRARKTEISCVLVNSTNACNSYGWASFNLEAGNTIQVSHVGGRGAKTWALTCCLPGCASVESWNQKQNQDRMQTLFSQDAGVQSVISTAVPMPAHHSSIILTYSYKNVRAEQGYLYTKPNNYLFLHHFSSIL